MKCYPLLPRWVIVIALLLACSAFTANAAVYLKFGDIEGESQAVGHEDEIDVLSWSWGVTRTDDIESGMTRDGTGEFLEMEITKVLGKASVKLIESCVRGIVVPEAILVVDRPNESGGSFKLLEIKMSNVRISSDSIFGSVESIESFKLNFTKVEMTYSVQNPDGSLGGNVDMSYDLETGGP